MRRTLTLRKLRRILRRAPERIWGSGAETAVDRIIRTSGWVAAAEPDASLGKYFRSIASSFAEQADLADFERSKLTRRTNHGCFRLRDNGVGQFGKLTAQWHTPMVALHRDDMIWKWGSMSAAAHKRVRIVVGVRKVITKVEDRCGVRGRIDLNPAAALALGLNPPFLVECTWSWA